MNRSGPHGACRGPSSRIQYPKTLYRRLNGVYRPVANHTVVAYCNRAGEQPRPGRVPGYRLPRLAALCTRRARTGSRPPLQRLWGSRDRVVCGCGGVKWLVAGLLGQRHLPQRYGRGFLMHHTLVTNTTQARPRRRRVLSVREVRPTPPSSRGYRPQPLRTPNRPSSRHGPNKSSCGSASSSTSPRAWANTSTLPNLCAPTATGQTSGKRQPRAVHRTHHTRH